MVKRPRKNREHPGVPTYRVASVTKDGNRLFVENLLRLKGDDSYVCYWTAIYDRAKVWNERQAALDAAVKVESIKDAGRGWMDCRVIMLMDNVEEVI